MELEIQSGQLAQLIISFSGGGRSGFISSVESSSSATRRSLERQVRPVHNRRPREPQRSTLAA